MNINNELEDKLLKQPFAEEADRDAEGQYIKVLHRMFYLAYDANGCARLALCLYNLSLSDASEHLIVNSLTGETIAPETYSCEHLLSSREC